MGLKSLVQTVSNPHSIAYMEIFGSKFSSECGGDTKCQKWSNAAKMNIVKGLLSYIPIVNLIAFSIIIADEQKKSQGQFLKTEEGKALLGRTILLSLGFIPLVMLLDTIGTLMKLSVKCQRVAFERKFKKHPEKALKEFEALMGQEMPPEIKQALKAFARKIGVNLEGQQFDHLSSQSAMQGLGQEMPAGPFSSLSLMPAEMGANPPQAGLETMQLGEGLQGFLGFPGMGAADFPDVQGMMSMQPNIMHMQPGLQTEQTGWRLENPDQL